MEYNKRVLSASIMALYIALFNCESQRSDIIYWAKYCHGNKGF
jgi:hypothetical protein